MPKLNDILREIDQLSEDEKRILMDYVKQMGAQTSQNATMHSRRQLFGRYRGQVYVADDFDAELPDALWKNEPLS